MLWYLVLIPAFLFPSIILGASCSDLATTYLHQNGFFEASLLMIVAHIEICSSTVIHLIQQAKVLKL